MHHFIFARKDTTIYNDYPTQNTGKDEILEILKTFHDNPNSDRIINSRALLHFNLNDIIKLMSENKIAPDARFYLNMKICRVSGQQENTNLYIYPMSSSWVQGYGKRYDTVLRTEGASWTASDGEVPTYWTNTGSDFYDNIPITASLWPDENTFQSTGHYTYELSDLRTDITSLVYDWLSESYDNNGIIIKRSDEEENDSRSYGNIQFYSTDTHTIYNPKLEVAWDDSSFLPTGSVTQSIASDLFVYPRNMKPFYNNRETVNIKLGSRYKYPTRSYAYENPYIMNQYLPSSSYYSIIDGHTQETIIPFDTGSTKISCNEDGSYFNLMMSGLHPERYYSIRIKIIDGDIETLIDFPQQFKVYR